MDILSRNLRGKTLAMPPIRLEMVIGLHALKLLNSIEKIQLRIMFNTFNGKPDATIVSCYSPTMPLMKRILLPSTTGYLTLLDIFKNNILISGDINPQIGEDENRFCLPYLPNRNGEYLTDFYSRTVFHTQRKMKELQTYTWLKKTQKHS